MAKRLNRLLNTPPPDLTLTPETPGLLEQIDNLRLHAHSYPFIHNLTYGDFRPTAVLNFAYRHELQS